jgi:hypothetical protein
MIVPSLEAGKGRSRRAACALQMKGHGQALMQYASDYDAALATFSWRRGRFEPAAPYADLDPLGPEVLTDLDAAAMQAAQLMRLRLNKRVPFQYGGTPHPLSSHLVVQDYLGLPWPNTTWTCPDDVNLEPLTNAPTGAA